MVLVDSSVWIEALRRNGNLHVKVALESLLDAYEAQWCSPVRLEVMGGARRQDRAQLERHFSVISYRACNELDWNHAVSLGWKIRDEGITIPWFDVMIASLALTDGVRLYTVDKHFEKIATITGLQLYTPGYGGAFRPA